MGQKASEAKQLVDESGIKEKIAQKAEEVKSQVTPALNHAVQQLEQLAQDQDERFGNPQHYENVPRLFGVPLASLARNPSGVPAVVDAMVGMIEANGMKHADDMFRLSAPLEEVRALQRMWALSGIPSFPEGCSPRVVAGLLIVFLHELPESVVSADVYDCFIAVQDITDKEAKVRNLRHLYNNLSMINRAVLLRLAVMLRRFADQGARERDLAAVFGPLLLRTPVKLGTIRYFALPAITGTMEDIIVHHETIVSGLAPVRDATHEHRADVTLRMASANEAQQRLYAARPATFGPELSSLPTIAAEMIMVDPPEATGPLLNFKELEGKIAVVERGVCSFSHKILEAHAPLT